MNLSKLIPFIILIHSTQTAVGQAPFGSRQSWLDDNLTIRFPNGQTRPYLGGIRITVEPQLGWIAPIGNNRLEIKQLTQIPKAGIETNIYDGWIALQILYIAPSLANFDSKSEVVKNGILLTSDKSVQIDGGLTVGVTILDGIISLGVGYVNYDQRDFDQTNPKYKPSYKYDTFGYLNIQLLSAIRSAIKTQKSVTPIDNP